MNMCVLGNSIILYNPLSLSTDIKAEQKRSEKKAGEQFYQHFLLFHSSETNSYKSQNILTYGFQLEDQ